MPMKLFAGAGAATVAFAVIVSRLLQWFILLSLFCWSDSPVLFSFTICGSVDWYEAFVHCGDDDDNNKLKIVATTTTTMKTTDANMMQFSRMNIYHMFVLPLSVVSETT